ncbi:MAG: MucB/RseB C-terminal domain-containing protein [Dokdonella sp.]
MIGTNVSGRRSAPSRFAWLLIGLTTFASASAAEHASAPPTPSGTDPGQTAPAALLEQMESALRALDYQGSFIFQSSSRIDAMRIFHTGGARERERLVGLNGARVEVVRDGRTITVIQVDQRPSVFPTGRAQGAGLLPLVPDTQGRVLAPFYSLRLDGEDRVAGYSARIVEILPSDALRYGYRLWLEQGSHLPLRVALIASDQRVVEQFMFVALAIGNPTSPLDMLPSQTVDKATVATDEVSLKGDLNWRVNNLPPGYSLMSRGRRANDPANVEHLLYSDGLASVSLYVEAREDAPVSADVALSRGSMNVYIRDVGNWRLTVLGDVPGVTVERIAQSITWVPQQAN